MRGLIISYSDFFPTKVPDVDSLVKLLPSRISIQFLSYCCAQLHLNPSSPSVQEDLLTELLKNQSQKMRNDIWDKYNKYKAKKDTLIFDTYNIMEVLNKVLVMSKRSNNLDSNPEDEFNLMMTILMVNEKYNKFTLDKSQDNLLDKFCSMVWPVHIFSTELRLRKNYHYESYRGLIFCDFIANNKDITKGFKELFNLNHDEISKYPVEVLNLYLQNGFNVNTKKFISQFSLNLENQIPWIKSWILDVSNDSPQNYKSKDYNTLRSTPIIKLTDNLYCVSNWNFILDKLYTGLLFDLYYKTSINNDYSDFSGFKGVIGESFSEFFAELLYRSALYKHTIKCGHKNSEANQDLYIRQGKRIALVENKDALFVKDYDYKKIRATIDSKLVNEKGVSQLIKLLSKMKDKPDFMEDGLLRKVKTRCLIVYPVLLVSDSAFTMTGMEDYLQRVFKKKLAELGTIPFKVSNLVIIDVHSLMNLHDEFIQDRNGFFSTLDKYFKKKKKLIKSASKPSASDNQISSQFQGFVELVGKTKVTLDHKDSRSLLSKTTTLLKIQGIKE